MYRSLKSSNSVRFSIKSHNYSYRIAAILKTAAILNITRFQTVTYVFLEAENITKISGQVACFLQKVPTGLYICTFAAALICTDVKNIREKWICLVISQMSEMFN